MLRLLLLHRQLNRPGHPTARLGSDRLGDGDYAARIGVEIAESEEFDLLCFAGKLRGDSDSLGQAFGVGFG